MSVTVSVIPSPRFRNRLEIIPREVIQITTEFRPIRIKGGPNLDELMGREAIVYGTGYVVKLLQVGQHATRFFGKYPQQRFNSGWF